MAGPGDQAPQGATDKVSGTKPAQQRRSVLRIVGISVLLLILLVVIAVPSGLYWTLRSESGTAWALSQVPGLTTTNLRGTLLGDFSADRVELDLGNDGRLVLEEPAWRGLNVTRSPIDGHWVAVEFKRLQARSALLIPPNTPPSTDPLAAPPNLRLPVTLKIDELAVGEFNTAALGDKPVRDLQGSIELGAKRGSQHQIEITNVIWDQLRASGSLRIASDAPMDLETRLSLRPSTKPTATGNSSALDDWAADIALDGPLAKPRLKANAKAGGKELLQADVVLLPFEKWPLADLQARTRDLDLTLFSSAAPKTSLTGSAAIKTKGLDQPASAKIELANAEAGAWNEAKLPLRSLQLDLQARPDQPDAAKVRRFEAELGSAERPAGRLTGQGELDKNVWQFSAQLDKVLPARLDARAPVMTLSGPIKLSGKLPPAAPAASASAPAPVQPGGDMSFAAKADLSGRFDAFDSTPPPAAGKAKSGKGAAKAASAAPPGMDQPVKIALDLAAILGAKGSISVDIKDLQASAGKAKVQLGGTLQRDNELAPMVIKAKAGLDQFDPRPWLPGDNREGWRKAPTRIDANADVDIRFTPPAAPARPAPASKGSGDPVQQAMAALHEVLAQLRGKLDLNLRPSELAGIPIDGAAALQVSGASPGPGEAGLQLLLQSGGNQVKANYKTRADRPAADLLDLNVAAPNLASLAPVASLLGMPVKDKSGKTLGGNLNLQAQASGRWPALRSEGKLDARAVQLPDLALQRGDLNWKLGTSPDSPIDLKAELAGLAVAEATVDRIVVKLDGTARAHRLELDADSKLLPPAWTDALTGVLAQANGTAKPAAKTAAAPAIATPKQAPTSARLRASGGLIDAVGISAKNQIPTASGWRGRIDEINLRSGARPEAGLALRSKEIELEARWAGTAPTLNVKPGRIEMQAGPTIAALRWSRIELQAATPGAKGQPASAPKINLEGELEPIAIAPILARLQPEFGWGGDLEIGGRFLVQSQPVLKADIVFERRRGDLSVTDESSVKPLGFTDLRLALKADNGVWDFTQALAGSTLGKASGAFVARTGSPTAWPDPQTPVEGVIELQVQDLGTWGRWIPPGWRLGGALQSSASIAGRLGAPEYIGKVRGRNISVRNFVEGVNVTDGEIGVTLKGETATIDVFTAKAGPGFVTLAGNASFGATPEARLTLKADKFQVLGRVDRRIVASGTGQLLLEAKKIALKGKFKVDEGLIDFTRGDAPSLSDDVIVIRTKKSADGEVLKVSTGKDGEKPPQPTQSAAARALDLDLRVDLGQNLNLKGRGLKTGLRGELHVTSPGGKLAVNGTVSTFGGTFKAYGQDLKIERGSVIFIGPVDNPRLDIEAIRGDTDSDVKVGVQVGGTTSNLRIRLFSEPEMPEIDKLSLLVLGKKTEGLGRAETALMQQAAMALLAGEGEGTTDKVSRALGLDEFSLRQTDGEVKQTVVAVGKQISKDIYVGYERGLNATAGSWQLIYRLAQRFTLRAQAGFENSLDLIWTWRWQ